MLMEEQMIVSGVARIWCDGGTKRGVHCEDPDSSEANIRLWHLYFSHNLFQKNFNGQRRHFTKIRSISKFIYGFPEQN